MGFRSAVIALAAAVTTAGAAFADSFADRVNYVTFASASSGKPITVAGRFVRPGDPAKGPWPAVVILHGSGGPSEREDGYAAALAASGIASLTIDEWVPRGFMNGGRPAGVPETLTDVYAARQWLAAQPDISSDGIGVMGFSFGGVASMLTATRVYQTQFGGAGGFQAIMPVYPVCWVYNRVPGYAFQDLTGAPVMLAFGTADEYDDAPRACPDLVEGLAPADRSRVRLLALPGAHHAFDKPGEDRKIVDAYGHRGKGGLVQMRFNRRHMETAHRAAAKFFAETLGAKQP